MEDKINHDNWLKKFKRTKKGKIFELLHELRSAKSEYKLSKEGAATYLASTLAILSRGTEKEEDVREIIEIACPEYFDK